MNYDKALIYDYKLLEEIYADQDTGLQEIPHPVAIRTILDTHFDPGKGGEIGFSGFVFLAVDEGNILYCKMEDFWHATKDVDIITEFEYNFDKDDSHRLKTTTKTRKEAWTQLKEVAGENTPFLAHEQAYIFFPYHNYSNQAVIDGEILCSKFSNPELHFRQIPFYIGDDIVNINIRKITADFKKSKHFNPEKWKSGLKKFIKKIGEPTIEISRNHYKHFYKEIFE